MCDCVRLLTVWQVGPIAGGWISEKTTWRWCFWSTSLLTVAIQALGMVYLRETYAPVLLSRRAARLRRETGDDRYHSATETPDRTLSKVMKKALSRPFRLLATQPIIQVLAVYMCFLYGVMYLVLTTFPIVCPLQSLKSSDPANVYRSGRLSTTSP